jgi:hypothetical protein
VDLDGRNPVLFGGIVVAAAVTSLGIAIPAQISGIQQTIAGNYSQAQQTFMGQQVAFASAGLGAYGVLEASAVVGATAVKTALDKKQENAVFTAASEEANLSASPNSGRGYSSFSSYKRAEGSAQSGYELHHIVEQNPMNRAKFSPEQLHNTENIISLPKDVHRAVSGYYSKVADPISGERFRDVVSSRSFADQLRIGKQVLGSFVQKATKK